MVTTSETATILESKSVLAPPDLNDNPSGQSRLLPIPRRIIPAFSHFPLHPGRNFPRGSVSVASDLVPPMFFFLARVGSEEEGWNNRVERENDRISLHVCSSPRSKILSTSVSTNKLGRNLERRLEKKIFVEFYYIIYYNSFEIVIVNPWYLCNLEQVSNLARDYQCGNRTRRMVRNRIRTRTFQNPWLDSMVNRNSPPISWDDRESRFLSFTPPFPFSLHSFALLSQFFFLFFFFFFLLLFFTWKMATFVSGLSQDFSIRQCRVGGRIWTEPLHWTRNRWTFPPTTRFIPCTVMGSVSGRAVKLFVKTIKHSLSESAKYLNYA